MLMKNMAKVVCLHISPSALFVLCFLFCGFVASIAENDRETNDDGVFGTADNGELMGGMKETLSHFRFYWHDQVSGKSPSAIPVVPPVSDSKARFGLVRMFDNALTIGPSIDSKLVGRAQGFYAQADLQKYAAFLMTQNLLFLEGKYNGSTIAILGRNPILDSIRELPIIGGSGLFRFARGYVKLQTYTANPNTSDATVEYNVYVLHYD